MSRRTILLSLAFAFLTVLVSTDVSARDRDREPSPEVRAVLDRIDRAQEDVRTLTARITETRTLKLLAEQEVYEGELRYERPDRIRWDYVSPLRSSYVLDDGRMTGWIPERNRVELVDLTSRQKRLRRLFAIGQDSESLAEEFEIALVGEAEAGGEDVLSLVPRSRRIRKRVSEIRLTVGTDVGLPTRIAFTTGDGDRVELQLTELDVNGELAAGAFELSYPEDAKVVRGFSELTLPGFSDGDAGAGEL